MPNDDESARAMPEPTPSLAGHQMLSIRAIDVRPGDITDRHGDWCTVDRNDDSTEGETSTRSIMVTTADDRTWTVHIIASEHLAILRPPKPNEQPTLADAYMPDGVQFNFDGLRDFFHRAVTYALPHATGSRDGWRTASVEELAERMTNFLVAGIGPALSREAVEGGVKAARQFLADERAKAEKAKGAEHDSLSYGESVTSWHEVRLFDGPDLFEGDKIVRQWEVTHPDECRTLPPGALCWFYADEARGRLRGQFPDEVGAYRVRGETRIVGGHEEPDYEDVLVFEPLPHSGTHDPSTCGVCAGAYKPRVDE